MTRSAPPDRRYADEHLAELTDRQRQVLDLIAAGNTNAQIGEALDITLDGAKWNVSEILTRLGFSSREEAADYWRSRRRIRRQLSRPFRALAGLPLAAKAAGAVGAVAVAGLGAWWAFAGSTAPERATPAIPPFYLEATVEVTKDAATGSGIAGGSASAPPETIRSTLRWWYRDQDEWRWEVETTEPPIRSGTTTAVADDKTMWTYSNLTNTYTKAPIPELPEGVVMPPSLAALVGPAPARSVDQYLEMIRSTGNPPMHADLVGEDRILGRRTLIIELGPTASSSVDGQETSRGTARIWIDPERMFILRMVSDDGDSQSYRIDVTTLRYDESVVRDSLLFTPPAGSRLVDSSDVTSNHSGGVSLPPGSASPSVPPGFLAPTYVPSGYSVRGTSVESGAAPDRPAALDISFTRDDQPSDYVLLQQRTRAGGLPDSARTGQVITVNGHDAYRNDANGITSITWAENDLMIVLSADALPFDELLRMAESIGPH